MRTQLTRVCLVECCLVDAEQADIQIVGTAIRRLEDTKPVVSIHELAGLDRHSERGLRFGLGDQFARIHRVRIPVRDGWAATETFEDAGGDYGQRHCPWRYRTRSVFHTKQNRVSGRIPPC